MENGNSGFSSSDAVLWGAMNNMGRGGGGGAWGAGYGYGAPFAGPASNAVRINRNADMTRLSLDRISDQNEENRRILADQNTTGLLFNNFNRVCDRITDMEVRTNDRFRDQDREMAAIARENAKCCCELKEEIKAVETRTITRDLDRAERELQTQKILTTCGCGCGGGVRPCPPVA